MPGAQDAGRPSGPPTAGAPDWGLGHYESTARQLLPAAEAVVAAAAIAPGQRVLDLGCGTGNAALLAAEHGGRVVAIDPAPRLLDVARSAAADRGVDIEFLPGHAGSMPLADASVDTLLSVFAVIFAPDPAAAAAEMARVITRTGQLLVSAWIPGGAIAEINAVAAEAVQRVLGAPPRPDPFRWHERVALAGLLAPHGFAVTVEERQLAFTGPSPAEFLDRERLNHPLAAAGHAILESCGEAPAVRRRMLDVLERDNEDPRAFRVTSRYIIAIARRRE